MNVVPLGKVADFINGVAFKPEDWGDEGTKIIRIQNLNDKNKPYNRTTRSVDKKYIVQTGDILVSWSASLGVFEWSDEPALLNQHIFRVVPHSSKTDKAYLKYALVKALDDMQHHLHGATMQHVNRGEFLGTEIYLPPLEEQKRIATILDKADAIRRKRAESLKLLDDLLRATFLDMFGDPTINPKNWKTCVLGDVLHSAKDGPHVSPEYASEGIPFLSTRHIRPNGVLWEDLKYLSHQEAEKQWKKCKPQRGDILYTKGGTTGIATIVDFDTEIAVWVHVALLKPIHKAVDFQWLAAMLNSEYCYQQSQHLTHGITNKDLGLKRMVKIKHYLPPIDKQREYADFEKKIREQKSKSSSFGLESDTLFHSLVARAFKGEL